MVRLSEEQRRALNRLVRTGTHRHAPARTGTHPAAMLRRAQVLLRADADADADADGPEDWSDTQIGEALGCSLMTVRRVRQQFAAEGLDATLHRRRPTGRPYRKPDGRQEAQLVALACSKAPEGHARRTMVLLAERLVEMNVVGAIDPRRRCGGR